MVIGQLLGVSDQSQIFVLNTTNEPSVLEKAASQALLRTTDVYARVDRTGDAIAIRFIGKETEE